jgi:hypothetical protein
MSRRVLTLLVLVGLAVLPQVRGQDEKKEEKKAEKTICEEGFIRSWLMLAPIPLAEGEDPGAALDKAQVKDEATLSAKDGDKIKVGEKELTWKKFAAEEYFFDFNKLLGAQTENAMGYAITTILAEDEMKDVVLKIGSDDGCKIWLNGKEVGKHTEDRAVDKDQNTFEKLTLKKGENMLVFKVVNNSLDWSGCARFVDTEGKPLKGIKAVVK